MSWSPRTLKSQLTILFLLLTLGPAMLLTALAAREAIFAVARWENEGVERALSGSMAMARELLARTENDLRQRGQLLAADEVLQTPFDSDAVRGALATSYNLDFVQVYDLSGQLLFEVTRDPLLEPPGALPGVAGVAATPPPFLEFPTRDLLAYAGYLGSPGETESILLVGLYLDEGFYLRRDDLTTGVAYYQRLPTLIRLKQRVVLLTLGGVVLLLAVLATWTARKLAARVSGPVESLGTGMERVARGDTDVRVQPRGTEEMVGLIRSFNLMSGELVRSRRELARTERLAAWREAARRVAHEIKNALTPITFSAHRLRKSIPSLPPDEQPRFEESLGTVLEEIEGLGRLASSFSELARLPVPEPASLDLRELVEAATSSFTQEHRRIQTELPDAAVRIEADRTLLRQALTNLIKNAVEATGPEDRIWVRLGADDAGARITVEDEGEGWAPEIREQALDPYVTTKVDGTGLGLSVVQRTMLQHGGFLELDDRPGGGARVTLVFPFPSAGRGPGGDGSSQEVT